MKTNKTHIKYMKNEGGKFGYVWNLILFYILSFCYDTTSMSQCGEDIEI